MNNKINTLDIEIDIDIVDFIDAFICDNLDSLEGCEIQLSPYELTQDLCHDIIENGTYTQSSGDARNFLLAHIEDVYKQIVSDYKNYGELLADPIYEPEKFQVNMIVRECELKLAASSLFKEEVSLKKVILSRNLINDIKEKLGISGTREKYLEALYNPDPDKFTLEKFGEDFEQSFLHLKHYDEYLDMGYVELSPNVSNLIKDTCKCLKTNLEKYREAATGAVKENSKLSIQEQLCNKKEDYQKKSIFRAVDCR